jgi:ABC-type uncharacterized transport system substrate-binding protein
MMGRAGASSLRAVAKRLRFLNDLVPKATRIAVVVNPTNTATAEPTIRDVPEAATTIGLQIQILNAATIDDIDAAFATLARERPDVLYVAPDAFFTSRRGQFATLTARDRIPSAYSERQFVCCATRVLGKFRLGASTPRPADERLAALLKAPGAVSH